MPNIVIPNTPINASNEKFHAMWKLTRGLLAAGWRYKASADTFQKDASAIPDPSKDMWSVGGYTNLTGLVGQSGSAATISIPIIATGTAPPDIKVTGTPLGLYNLNIQITTGGARGTAVFKWSTDGGNTFTTGVTTAAANALAGTGLTIAFPNGTYTNDNVWTTSSTFLTVTGLTGMAANSVGHALTVSGASTAANNATYRIASFISSSSVTVYSPFAAGLTAYNNAGIAASITTFVGTTVTITGGANFTANSVGHYITITGASSAGNNGTFPITAFISASSVSYTNASGVATDANNPNIHWVETIPSTSSAPYTDTASGAITWAEKAGGTAASISSFTNGVATLTGLTGMTSASVGHALTIINAATVANNGTFLISAFLSATSVKIFNPNGVAPDGNNGSIQWVERDPTQDTYPLSLQGTNEAGAWINLQGPSTMKIPIGTAVPSPAFIRGEKVTQAATGCEGEILGVVTDATGGTGFIVIAPRVNGSSAGARGWDTSVIAAQSAPTGSGASVTPSGSALEYVREIVIWKDTASAGHLYYQCIDQANEATPTALVGRFSTMASTLSQVTPSIPPGGATGGLPTTNGFPTAGTLVLVGTGGSGLHSTGSADYTMQSAVNATGLIQVICANNIEASGVSQDGSFTLMIGLPATSASAFTLSGLQRLDDTEDGDIDPYVYFTPTTLGVYARSRTVETSSPSITDVATTSQAVQGTSTSYFLGFRRRGFATGDAFQEFASFCLNTASTAQFALGNNFANPETVACTFSTTSIRVREPIWIISTQLGSKMRKGTLRWWYVVAGGNSTDTLDGKRWMQGSSASTASAAALVVGPWDGSTVPSQS